ncbi:MULTISPECIES: SMC-Scp complex subunit ScpB [unclassified Alteromonas]|uniref:SMC-Scp complex subunit ScpB n=1 Tax=unclassified Alteromonas TaxID=2614992 RepID=UPI000C3A676C|nr:MULTISPECIES: SMC-Scp complex subunit ScpB [unclassified Alteromonas]AYA64027.1 SMC-Scp complex subunit ScpB [Alteromonas sp. RKMC-009]MBT80513.1 SMC-Scp complex subunit ScpB [Alteromonadaceae bacterium]MDO6476761.1 SMC-Scp complex subunit ScpB [Alteromonas sp. 1_MG-2023]MEC7690386.1 SMC-Scp complex subunit ScpB [Pseudomonadota bacterium]
MKKINKVQLKQLVEAALFVADAPMTKLALRESVLAEFTVSERALNEVLKELVLDYQPRGIQLVEVASGYRFQSLDSLSPWLSRMWQENAPRYSRAMLETLALIAYRQPITRGEIEAVRGVAVSSNIIRTLTERDWIKVVGHKEVPGRPSLYATTRQFLDYFSLKSLADLPGSEVFEGLEDNEQPPATATLEAPSDDDRAIETAEQKREENE